MLPHRYPFLMVDRVIAFEPGKSRRRDQERHDQRAVLRGHFPGHPVMPGVLIIEAMAQAGGVLAYKLSAPHRGELPGALSREVDNVRFKRVVVPGDQSC